MGAEIREGYQKLADFMSSYPEFAVFKRFEFLNTLNILYLQAELVELEAKLKGFLKEDIESKDGNRNRSARDWYFLANEHVAKESKSWETMLRARTLLKEYSKFFTFWFG